MATVFDATWALGADLFAHTAIVQCLAEGNHRAAAASVAERLVTPPKQVLPSQHDHRSTHSAAKFLRWLAGRGGPCLMLVATLVPKLLL